MKDYRSGKCLKCGKCCRRVSAYAPTKYGVELNRIVRCQYLNSQNLCNVYEDRGCKETEENHRPWNPLADKDFPLPATCGYFKERMKLFSIYTDNMATMKDEWFLKTIRDDFNIYIKYIGNIVGDYGTPAYHYCLKEKIELIQEAIRDNQGEVIVWADIDVQFFGEVEPLVKDVIEGKDIIFSRYYDKPDTGFVAIRCNEKTQDLFDSIAERMIDKTDVDVLHKILREKDLAWGLFSDRIQSGFSSGLPEEGILLYHSNGTDAPSDIGSAEIKYNKMKEIKALIG